MGILITFVFVMIGSFLMLFSMKLTQDDVQTQKKMIVRNIEENATSPHAVKATIGKYTAEDIEHLLIRGCQFKQALVVRCQECYLQNPDLFFPGGGQCNLPTDSFCRGAKALDPSNIDQMWSWLPHSRGPIGELRHFSTIDPVTLRNVSQLDAAVRFNVLNTMSPYMKASSRYIYVRPSGGSIGDPCSLEGIVFRKN